MYSESLSLLNRLNKFFQYHTTYNRILKIQWFQYFHDLLSIGVPLLRGVLIESLHFLGLEIGSLTPWKVWIGSFPGEAKRLKSLIFFISEGKSCCCSEWTVSWGLSVSLTKAYSTSLKLYCVAPAVGSMPLKPVWKHLPIFTFIGLFGTCLWQSRLHFYGLIFSQCYNCFNLLLVRHQVGAAGTWLSSWEYLILA